MTKTEHLSLNVLEPHDPVAGARAALNENARAVDAAITADRAAAAAERGAVWNGINAAQADATAALTGLGAGGQNCRVAFGSYPGAGKAGEANALRLEFDFMPLMLTIMRPLSPTSTGGLSEYSPSVMLRGCPHAHSDTTNAKILVTWEDRAVSWYCVTNSPGAMNNGVDYTYYYVVIGCPAPAPVGEGEDGEEDETPA